MTAENLVADPGSVEEIASAIKARRTDPPGLLESSLRRIEAVEKDVQGWCLLDRERALPQAETCVKRRKTGRIRSVLHGIPIAVKDVLDVAGLPTRAGSKTRPNCAKHDRAHIVTRLRVAGAIILGKAHTTEFAYFDGPPPTRNPQTSPIRPAARAPDRRRWSPPAWCR